MKLFSKNRKGIFNSNITDFWEKKQNSPLFVDIDSFSICGVELGQPIQKLSFLGPSDFIKSRDKSYVYKEKGITIVELNGIFNSFFVAIEKDTFHKRYRGEWIFEGKKIDITVNTKPQYLKELLGEPVDSWEDAVEICYGYKRENLELEFLWNNREKLKYVDISLLQKRMDE